MEFKELIINILNKLNLNIKNNPSYKAILSKFFELTNDKMYNYRINISKEIYDEIKDLSKNITKSRDDNRLLYIECKDKTYPKFIEFTIEKNQENYRVTLSEENGERVISVKMVNVRFTPQDTTWRISKDTTDPNGFYSDYERRKFKYDKNHKLIPNTFDDELDKEFSEIFNIPIKYCRKYRENFRQYADYLDKCKKLGAMKELDKSYCSKEIAFGEVFKYNDLTNYFVDTRTFFDIDGTTEELLENDFDDENNDFENEDETLDGLEYEVSEPIRRNNIIRSNFKKTIGNKGEFTMSRNLIVNIASYIDLNDNTLYTNGFVLRKLDNKFKLYYITVTNEEMTNINREITLAEAQELFYSYELNKDIEGLEDFFEIKKGRKLELS